MLSWLLLCVFASNETKDWKVEAEAAADEHSMPRPFYINHRNVLLKNTKTHLGALSQLLLHVVFVPLCLNTHFKNMFGAARKKSVTLRCD